MSLDTQLAEWRSAVMRGRSVDAADADELESHLREQVADLQAAGLADDEAFLIAVKRLGQVDTLTAEFAREHSDRLWKQLSVARTTDDGSRRPFIAMLAFSALAIAGIQIARLLSHNITEPWFLLNASVILIVPLAAYFATVRRMRVAPALVLLGIVVAVVVSINLFPFARDSTTQTLVALHLPVVLWFVVGAAYVGGAVLSSSRRMDFVRFTGEWAIYLVLIVLGGGVLIGLTTMVLTPIAPESIGEVISWVLPSGGAAAVIVAAWLVEAKKSVIENLAPVLTAIFTPLFAVMLLVAAVVYALAGVGQDFDRELLTVFDVLLIVVLALVVYGISARTATRSAGVLDVLRLVAVAAAILLDVLVLASMLARIGEYGLTANRVAALGLNVLLLANLAVTAWLLGRVVFARDGVVRVERWQTDYLPVFAAWVVAVVVVVPGVFGFR